MQETDLSFEELEEIHELTESDSTGDRTLTPGECEMARDMHADGDSLEDVAQLLPIDERPLAVHLEGLCNCSERGGR